MRAEEGIVSGYTGRQIRSTSYTRHLLPLSQSQHGKLNKYMLSELCDRHCLLRFSVTVQHRKIYIYLDRAHRDSVISVLALLNNLIRAVFSNNAEQRNKTKYNKRKSEEK